MLAVPAPAEAACSPFHKLCMLIQNSLRSWLLPLPLPLTVHVVVAEEHLDVHVEEDAGQLLLPLLHGITKLVRQALGHRPRLLRTCTWVSQRLQGRGLGLEQVVKHSGLAPSLGAKGIV